MAHETSHEIESGLRVMDLRSPELDMLVCCARIHSDPAWSDRLSQLLEGHVDWHLLTELAVRHRVIPLVYHHLSRTAPDVLNLPELSRLVLSARGIAGRNLRLTSELLRVIEALDARRVPAIALKGPVLAASAFGNVAYRDFEDLDILVRRADIGRAAEVLASMDYRPERALSPDLEAAFLQSEHAFQFSRDGGRIVVEAHWRLQDRYLSFPFDEDLVWRASRVAQLFGKSVRRLSAADQLLYLCMHGAKHYWERLEWIACLPAVIRAEPDLNWQHVIEQAGRLGGVRILHVGLLLARDLDRNRLTEAPLRLLPNDPIASELAKQVWSRLDAKELSGSMREVYRFRFYLSARERLWDRVSVVRFASIRIPHPNSGVWQKTRLPESFLFAHYFLSPLRLLRKFGLRGLAGVLRPTQIP